ncbi:hypothetical protein G7046_g9047 [Stylonectria norvegica]|nr:hypothetical protein G7046_g9047 [Stylonectria norvegica]
MATARLRRQSPESISSTPEERSPRPSSAFEDFFEVSLPSSRPMSGVFASGRSTPIGATGPKPPTLTDILLDVSSPPWTLSAFMAYLSQNHCMETLEFTLDAQRYASFYNQLMVENESRSQECADHVCSLWEKLMQVYIISCAPREVNTPAHVRDHLLNLPSRPTPPHPSHLDEAGRIIFELMNDSLLVPFLQSVAPPQFESLEDHARSSRYHHHSKMGVANRSTTSVRGVDSDTDDSDCNSPTAMEPMTPPTTPPTSEWAFSTSPGGFQRAVAAHNKGWKKMGAKLGFNRESENGWNRTFDAGRVGESGESTVGNLTTACGGQPLPVVQKSIRLRSRNHANKAHEMLNTDSYHKSPLSMDSRDWKSLVRTYHHDANHSTVSIEALEVDPAEQIYIDLGTDEVLTNSSRATSNASTSLSDFSNYLQHEDGSEDVDVVATTLDPESCRHASTQGDAYGWDSMLSEKHNCPMEKCIHECETISLRYRRANGSKSSLLQRVFKVGASSSLSRHHSFT